MQELEDNIFSVIINKIIGNSLNKTTSTVSTALNSHNCQMHE